MYEISQTGLGLLLLDNSRVKEAFETVNICKNCC